MNKIKEIIKARLSFQSTKTVLEKEFGVAANLDLILSKKFFYKFQMWEEKKRNKFIANLGGKTNFSETKTFLLDFFEKING